MKQDFFSKIPAMIHHQMDGAGILKSHSYQDKNFSAWYQFDAKIVGACFGDSWMELNEAMVKWLVEEGYMK